MQEQVPLIVPYHLCRDVIGKCVAPVLIGVKPANIVDSVTMHQFIRLFLTEAILQTLTLHIEETLEARKPLVCLIKNTF